MAEPLQILLGNRSLTWLVVAFGTLTIAEWGYVTALAVDAFRHDGAIALGLVGFRLFFAAIGSVFSLPWVERHPGARTLTVIAGTRAAIVGASSALAATGAPLSVLLVLVALDAVVSGPYRPAQSTMLPVLARTPRELAASAAGVSIVKTLAQAIGAMGGGFILVVTTPAVAFAGAAALLLGAAVVTMRFANVAVPTPIAVQPSKMRERTRGTFEAIREPHVGGLLTVSGLRTPDPIGTRRTGLDARRLNCSATSTSSAILTRTRFENSPTRASSPCGPKERRSSNRGTREIASSSCSAARRRSRSEPRS